MRSFITFIASLVLLGHSTNSIAEEVAYTELSRYQTEQKDWPFTRQHSVDIELETESTGLIISDHKVLFSIEQKVTPYQHGEIEDCDGYKDICLTLYDEFKFMLPKDFAFDLVSYWSWHDYHFKAMETRSMMLLGKQMELTEIVGINSKNRDMNVTFYVNEELGLVYFSVASSKPMMTFMLAGNTGLWASNEVKSN